MSSFTTANVNVEEIGPGRDCVDMVMEWITNAAEAGDDDIRGENQQMWLSLYGELYEDCMSIQ